MVENTQSTEKKELTEIFCLRLNLEQKRYKKRMLKMSPDAVFGKAYEINCMLSIYETLIESKRLIFRYDRKIPDYFSVAGAP